MTDATLYDYYYDNVPVALRSVLGQAVEPPLTGDWQVPSLMVDHPHQRAHQHQSILNVLARRAPDPKAYPNYPDVDIRDTGMEYRIEVEIPGIKNVDDIRLNWTSSRNLVLTGETKRPKIGMKSEDDEEKETNGDSGMRNAKGDYVSPHSGPPYLLVNERKIGFFRRIFNMPVEVHMEKLTAKLEAGLLSITVPKKGHTSPQGDGKVKIHSLD